VGVILPDVTVAVTNLEAVQGEAQGVGEVAGPAVRVTLKVNNATADQIDLSTAVTTMYFGDDQTPAQQLSGPGQVLPPTDLSPDSAATFTLIFSIPAEEREFVTVTFDYSVNEPAVVFSGIAPS